MLLHFYLIYKHSKWRQEKLMERLKNYKTLAYPEIDRERGFEEIINSPIYKNYVISEDGKTSGIIVYLKRDERLIEYIKVKDKFYNQSVDFGLSEEEKKNYKDFLKEYEQYKNLYNIRNHQNITEIRDVINKYGENAKIYLQKNPNIASEIEKIIRDEASAISKELEGNPSANEKISDKKEEE